MAVGNVNFPVMNPITGISLGTANAGIKQTVRADILVMQMAVGSSCAAVFTQNAFCAAPVHIARAHLSQSPRWLLINSGNANAGTGKMGITHALFTCETLATLIEGKPEQVLPFSTGVIGELLAVDKIEKALPIAIAQLAEDNWATVQVPFSFFFILSFYLSSCHLFFLVLTSNLVFFFSKNIRLVWKENALYKL